MDTRTRPAGDANGCRQLAVTTFTAWLQALATEHAERPALLGPDGEILSFADLECRVARLAGGLRHLGLRQGDRMASFLPNGVLAVELLLAAARLGAVTVGVNTRYRSDDLGHLLGRSRPRLLVSATDFLGIDFAGVVAGAFAGLDRPPRVLWPDDVAAMRGHDPMIDDNAEPSDLVVAFTTSGTTGEPKLAAHDHASTVRHLQAAGRSMRAGPDATGLLVLPICGTFGFVSLLSVLAAGGRTVVAERFDPAEAAALVERYRVTHLNGSDDMLLAVLDQGRDSTSWRHGVHAEFTGRGEEAVARAAAVGIRLTGVYGSSETFALLARWPPDSPVLERARNGGIPVDAATRARTVDSATGTVLPPEEPGELQLCGPSVLGGYLVEEGLAPPPLTVDGWLPTGDLGCVGPDGSFVYLARLGDALRLAGFLTDPVEIEQRLLTHPAVQGAQVVGAPKPAGGEVAVAFVVADRAVGEAELLDHCRRGLANYKVPARVVLVDAFPTVDGANGVKIRKTELRAWAGRLVL